MSRRTALVAIAAVLGLCAISIPGEISRRHTHMNVLRLDNINRVLDARLNVLDFEVWIIIPNDQFKRNRLPNQFENPLHRNACPCDTRFPKMDFRADMNSTHATSIPIVGKNDKPLSDNTLDLAWNGV